MSADQAYADAYHLAVSGNIRGAIDWLNEAEVSAAAILVLAEMLESTNHVAEAEQVYAQVPTARREDYERALNRRGAILADRNELATAEQLFADVAQFGTLPERAAALNNAGVIALRARDFKKAKESLLEAAKFVSLNDHTSTVKKNQRALRAAGGTDAILVTILGLVALLLPIGLLQVMGPSVDFNFLGGLRLLVTTYESFVVIIAGIVMLLGIAVRELLAFGFLLLITVVPFAVFDPVFRDRFDRRGGSVSDSELGYTADNLASLLIMVGAVALAGWLYWYPRYRAVRSYPGEFR